MEVACLAHVRRKFVDVHRSTGAAIAKDAIRRIAELYAIENEGRAQPPDVRAAIRLERSRPLLDELERRLAAQLRTISCKTPLAATICLALSRLPKVGPSLDDGRMEIDNNNAEHAMRPIALGRKKYLFMGSPAGGKAAAIAYTSSRPPR